LESVWFLSGLALWFLALLSAPWFVPPKDALANALGAMAILVTTDLGVVGNLETHLQVVRWVAVFYCVVIMVSSVVALLIHDKNKRSPIGRFFFRITDTFGQGELLYPHHAIRDLMLSNDEFNRLIEDPDELVATFSHVSRMHFSR